MVPVSQDKTVRLRCFEVIGFFLGDDHPDRFLFPHWEPSYGGGGTTASEGSRTFLRWPCEPDNWKHFTPTFGIHWMLRRGMSSAVQFPISHTGEHQLQRILKSVSCKWWSRVESNHHLRLRRPSSYPLDYGTFLAEAGRFSGPLPSWQGEGWRNFPPPFSCRSYETHFTQPS